MREVHREFRVLFYEHGGSDGVTMDVPLQAFLAELRRQQPELEKLIVAGLTKQGAERMNERQTDDLDTYIGQYDAAERQELAAASLTIDVAVLLHHAREGRGVTQKALAARIGLSPQAISKLERPQKNLTLGTLRRYLGALGYEIEIAIKEPGTGEVVETVTLVPTETVEQRHPMG